MHGTIEDVEEIIGILCNGVDITLFPRRTVESLNYSISKLEQDIQEKEVEEEFLKKFMIFTCATIIAPKSMLKGAHDIWDFIWASDVTVQKNWSKFMFSYLNKGIRRFKMRKSKYMQGCLLFL